MLNFWIFSDFISKISNILIGIVFIIGCLNWNAMSLWLWFESYFGIPNTISHRKLACASMLDPNRMKQNKNTHSKRAWGIASLYKVFSECSEHCSHNPLLDKDFRCLNSLTDIHFRSLGLPNVPLKTAYAIEWIVRLSSSSVWWPCVLVYSYEIDAWSRCALHTHTHTLPWKL